MSTSTKQRPSTRGYFNDDDKKRLAAAVAPITRRGEVPVESSATAMSEGGVIGEDDIRYEAIRVPCPIQPHWYVDEESGRFRLIDCAACDDEGYVTVPKAYRIDAKLKKQWQQLDRKHNAPYKGRCRMCGRYKKAGSKHLDCPHALWIASDSSGGSGECSETWACSCEKKLISF